MTEIQDTTNRTQGNRKQRRGLVLPTLLLSAALGSLLFASDATALLSSGAQDEVILNSTALVGSSSGSLARAQESKKQSDEAKKKEAELKKKKQAELEKKKKEAEQKKNEVKKGGEHDHDGDGKPDHAPGDHVEPSATPSDNPNISDDLLKPGPRIKWEFGANSHDFGEVTQGAIMSHTFELSSGGTEPLVIKQIKPTCGCTTGDLMMVNADGTTRRYNFGDPIPVGARVNLEANLNTKNKTNKASSSINIFSNDVRGPVQLALQAQVTPFFHVAPAFLNFQQMSVNDVRTEKITLGTHKGEKIGLTTDITRLPEGMFVDLLPSAPDAEGRSATWEIHVTLGPNLREGNMAQPVLLKTDFPVEGAKPQVDGTLPMQETSVTVSARVLGVVSHQPQYISMGLVRPGQVVPRTVRIVSHDEGFAFDPNTAIKVVGMKGTDGTYGAWEHADKFTGVVRPVDGENAIDVELRLDGLPESVQGSFRGTMIVEINHPEKKTVEVPITGVCRGGVQKK